MSVLVNFRIDEQLKTKMDKVCKDLGITMSAAFNMFANDLVKNKNISFSLNKKLKSGIDYSSFFTKMHGEDKNEFNNDLMKDDKYYINRVGNIIMLVPKDDPWAGLKESTGNMSGDFMIDREQIPDKERAEL